MTDLPRRRVSLSGLLRYLAGSLVSLGLTLGPMLLMRVPLEPLTDPVEEDGPDDDEPAAAASAYRPAAALTAVEHAAWVRLIRDLGPPATSAPSGPAHGQAAPRNAGFSSDEESI